MKGFVIEKFGTENLELKNLEPSGNGIRVKITHAAINPLDYNLINGKVVYGVSPMPHIAGSEVIGSAMEDGKEIKKGDRVMIYNRIFDSTCNQCISGNEHLCDNGGIWGVITNGGFQEIVSVPETNLLKIPEYITDVQAVSVPIAALTAYHALIRAKASPGEKVLYYGASGNTGILGMQIASIMGLEVYGVSESAIAKGYGAMEIFGRDSIPADFRADIVVNPLGASTFSSSMKHLKKMGRMITFGVLTGRNAEIDIAALYTAENSVIGSTGGTRKDLMSLLGIMKNHQIRIPVDSTFNFKDLPKGLKRYEEKHSGRILLKY